MITTKTVNVIIPVYNEEKTIGNVLQNLTKIKSIDKIFVINDASTDSSSKIISKYSTKVKVLTNTKNMGKGYSIGKALKNINSDLLIILDSDIIGYSKKHILDLCQPLINDKADFTLGTTKFKTYLHKSNGLSGLIGQRAYWVEDLKPLQKKMLTTTKYGLEIFLDKELEVKKYKLIYLKGTKHYTKLEKYPFFQALTNYGNEGISIIRQFFKDI